MSVPRLARVAALALGLSAGGCADRGPAPVPVAGRVTLDGQPVRDMMINFSPVGDTPGSGSIAYVEPDGRFVLQDVRGEPGAYPGEYRVHFYPAAVGPPDDPRSTVSGGVSRVPGVYIDPKGSPVTAAVPDAGGTLDIDLTKTGKGVKVAVTPGRPAP